MKNFIIISLLLLGVGTMRAQDIYEAVAVKFSLNDKDRTTGSGGNIVFLDNWQIQSEKNKFCFLHNGWNRHSIEMLKDTKKKDGDFNILVMKPSWDALTPITVKFNHASWKMVLSFPIGTAYYTFYFCPENLVDEYKAELQTGITK